MQWAESNKPLQFAPLPNCCYSHFGLRRWPPCGKPPKDSLFVKELFTIPFEQYSPYLPKCERRGCSDGRHTLGWCSNTASPGKDSVFWFQLKVEQFPRAFKDGNPMNRIAALELFGTLLLCKLLAKKQSDCRWAVATKESLCYAQPLVQVGLAAP